MRESLRRFVEMRCLVAPQSRQEPAPSRGSRSGRAAIRVLGANFGSPALLLCCALLGCKRSQPRLSAPEPHVTPAAPTHALATPPASQPTAALRDTMAAFTRALQAQDTSAFLGAFSKAQPWTMYSTHAVVPADIRVSSADLARALAAKNQMYGFLFGPNDWTLRSYALGAREQPWVALNAVQFGPPNVRRDQVWVAWRQEGAAWVVDTIAWPIQ
jgi:hypothetical protein